MGDGTWLVAPMSFHLGPLGALIGTFKVMLLLSFGKLASINGPETV